MRLAFIHQGYELYGSDRSFIESVAAIRASYPMADIEVVLPRHGPIVPALQEHANRVVVEPIWTLRRRGLLWLATLGLFRLPAALVRAARRLRTCDLVYINTSVVADYALAARAFPGKALLHIHEIPEGSSRRVLRALASWSRAAIIFNSQATRAAFDLPAKAEAWVIYNGIAGPQAAEAMSYDATRPLKVLMLGRVNRIKGQEVLLEALSRLPAPMRGRVAVRIIGSAFESGIAERALADLVETLGVGSMVSLEPFVPDPAPLYRWADIVVMPSRRPESLGRVAIEAMAYGRPPLVSAIGGLGEVVADRRTGWLVRPGDVAALADRLQAIITDPSAWRDYPAAARARYEAVFTEAKAARAVAAAVGDTIAKRLAGRAGDRCVPTASKPL